MPASMQAFACHRGPKYGMLNDIWETPIVLRRLLSEHLKPDGFQPPTRNGAAAQKRLRVSLPRLEAPLPASHGLAGRTPLQAMAACSRRCANKFTIVGSGTSYHAALVAEYMIEHIARIPVVVELASEYVYRKPIARPGDVFIVVSSSGETAESVQCLRQMKGSKNGNKVLTIAMVNQTDSSIARESDCCIGVSAGEEVGVASTKVFSSTVAAFVMLAVALGEESGTLTDAERHHILSKLDEIPDAVQTVIERESRALKQDSGAEHALEIGDCRMWDIGCQNVLANNFIFLGRGFNYPVALEGAMKCKEIAYIHAEGYPAAEMKHGPIALIDQFMPVVVIAPKSDHCYEKIRANIEEVNARSGATIAITEDDNLELQEICEYVIYVPRTHEFLMPLISVIPMQLLSYMMGVLRGNEIDHPRGLQKTISSLVESSPTGAARAAAE